MPNQKISLMKYVCRCSTAFSSQPDLIDHIERCQKQKSTKIAFNCKDHLKLEDQHMKVSVPITLYADFECFQSTSK